MKEKLWDEMNDSEKEEWVISHQIDLEHFRELVFWGNIKQFEIQNTIKGNEYEQTELKIFLLRNALIFAKSDEDYLLINNCLDKIKNDKYAPCDIDTRILISEIGEKLRMKLERIYLARLKKIREINQKSTEEMDSLNYYTLKKTLVISCANEKEYIEVLKKIQRESNIKWLGDMNPTESNHYTKKNNCISIVNSCNQYGINQKFLMADNLKNWQKNNFFLLIFADAFLRNLPIQESCKVTP